MSGSRVSVLGVFFCLMVITSVSIWANQFPQALIGRQGNQEVGSVVTIQNNANYSCRITLEATLGNSRFPGFQIFINGDPKKVESLIVPANGTVDFHFTGDPEATSFQEFAIKVRPGLGCDGSNFSAQLKYSIRRHDPMDPSGEGVIGEVYSYPLPECFGFSQKVRLPADNRNPARILNGIGVVGQDVPAGTRLGLTLRDEAGSVVDEKEVETDGSKNAFLLGEVFPNAPEQLFSVDVIPIAPPGVDPATSPAEFAVVGIGVTTDSEQGVQLSVNQQTLLSAGCQVDGNTACLGEDQNLKLTVDCGSTPAFLAQTGTNTFNIFCPGTGLSGNAGLNLFDDGCGIFNLKRLEDVEFSFQVEDTRTGGKLNLNSSDWDVLSGAPGDPGHAVDARSHWIFGQWTKD